MKKFKYILLAIVLGGSAMAEAGAKGEAGVLCQLLESSLSDPWQFDAVVSNESKHFDHGMVTYIQTQVKQLTKQAKQREAECEPFKNKFMGHDMCAADNPAKELAAWLNSVMQVAKGARWNQTDYGQGQFKQWNSCNNPALCEQLRLAEAMNSRAHCLLGLKD